MAKQCIVIRNWRSGLENALKTKNPLKAFQPHLGANQMEEIKKGMTVYFLEGSRIPKYKNRMLADLAVGIDGGVRYRGVITEFWDDIEQIPQEIRELFQRQGDIIGRNRSAIRVEEFTKLRPSIDISKFKKKSDSQPLKRGSWTASVCFEPWECKE